jgi:RNA polymerase sigma-70 factor (ECF subfamily)
MLETSQNAHTQNEHEIINQCKKGNKHAYRLLIEGYKDLIYSVALRFTHDPDTAEEVTQETFIKAWRHIKKFEGRSKFSTWLIAIATNKAKDILKEKRKILDTEDVDTVTEISVEESYIIKEPEDELMNKELGLHLKKLIDGLPDIYREAFILRHVELLSYEEISDIYKVSVEAVKMRVFRAREILKKQFYKEK